MTEKGTCDTTVYLTWNKMHESPSFTLHREFLNFHGRILRNQILHLENKRTSPKVWGHLSRIFKKENREE